MKCSTPHKKEVLYYTLLPNKGHQLSFLQPLLFSVTKVPLLSYTLDIFFLTFISLFQDEDIIEPQSLQEVRVCCIF